MIQHTSRKFSRSSASCADLVASSGHNCLRCPCIFISRVLSWLQTLSNQLIDPSPYIRYTNHKCYILYYFRLNINKSQVNTHVVEVGDVLIIVMLSSVLTAFLLTMSCLCVVVVLGPIKYSTEGAWQSTSPATCIVKARIFIFTVHVLNCLNFRGNKF